MDLLPVERGVVAYRALRGLPVLFHTRLKHQGRTLAVLQGCTEQEAHQRAQRLAEGLSLDSGSFTIVPA
jgi:hypothetical protein